MPAADPLNAAVGGTWLMLTFPLQGAEGVPGLRGQLGQEGPGVSPWEWVASGVFSSFPPPCGTLKHHGVLLAAPSPHCA